MLVCFIDDLEIQLVGKSDILMLDLDILQSGEEEEGNCN